MSRSSVPWVVCTTRSQTAKPALSSWTRRSNPSTIRSSAHSGSFLTASVG
ncbi:MAG: hypothetical protein MZV64_62890 [Ignavibacteriales bacterium]|nr:hypothetical protein [Ignavibacteriales bacterium]